MLSQALDPILIHLISLRHAHMLINTKGLVLQEPEAAPACGMLHRHSPLLCVRFCDAKTTIEQMSWLWPGEGVHPTSRGLQAAHSGNQYRRDVHHSGRGCLRGGPRPCQAEELQSCYRHGIPRHHPHLQASPCPWPSLPLFLHPLSLSIGSSSEECIATPQHFVHVLTNSKLQGCLQAR